MDMTSSPQGYSNLSSTQISKIGPKIQKIKEDLKNYLSLPESERRKKVNGEAIYKNVLRGTRQEL